MPNDVLAEDANNAMRSASEFLSTGRPDEAVAATHVRYLDVIQQRLGSEIAERSGPHVGHLLAERTRKLDAVREKEKAKRIEEAVQNQAACQQTFEALRQINGGAYPRNMPPILYSIPLILVGVAEWYVNYSTFASHFVPVFAIACTVLVAAVFAGASHLHGEYLKQISERNHPSLENRFKIGHKVALAIATILLIVAFVVVVWLRYELIAEQLGVGNSSSGAFGGPSTDMVWSRVAPTIIINVIIWGLGTLYSWMTHERVPNLRESYRALLRANSRLERVRRPIVDEETRIRAAHDREVSMNEVAVKEYRTLQDAVQDLLKRFETSPAPKEGSNVRKVR